MDTLARTGTVYFVDYTRHPGNQISNEIAFRLRRLCMHSFLDLS